MEPSAKDKRLGLNRPISRRDFVQGVAVASGAAVFASSNPGTAGNIMPNPYPPALTGLRGSHLGSFETAHALARFGQQDFGPTTNTEEAYDLIVVGAGASGLAAAYFYRQSHPGARILLLDNHDDFGGHAKRNEFTVDGRKLIGYGGSQSMESPSAYSSISLQLLEQLGVDLDYFRDGGYHSSFFKDNDLAAGLFFDKQHYGRSVFVPNAMFDTGAFVPTAKHPQSHEKAVSKMPLDNEAKQQLLRLLTNTEDALPLVSLFDLSDYLSGISYQTYVQRHCGVTSPALLQLLNPLAASYYSAGTEAITALDGLLFGLPGIQSLGVPGARWLRQQAVRWLADPYIFHYPDGNATVARLLVRSLIPQVAPEGKTALDSVNAQFDYRQLDRSDAQVQLRLNSTAVNVRQERGTLGPKTVKVTYVSRGASYEVSGGACVLACYNAMIPHICPSLPDQQQKALKAQVKSPLVYTNLALRNWRPAKQLGMGVAMSPKRFHQLAMLDFPVSVPGYDYGLTPDEPTVMHFSSALYEPDVPPKQGYRISRQRLLNLSFQAMERELREHVTELFSGTEFDPARDIAGITINRWPHGYAYSGFPLFDDVYPPGKAPHEIGRQAFGRVVIANSDAGARAYLDCAIDEAHRAVQELG